MKYNQGNTTLELCSEQLMTNKKTKLLLGMAWKIQSTYFLIDRNNFLFESSLLLNT